MSGEHVFSKTTNCPFCGRLNPMLTSLDGEAALPESGDFAICFGCAGVGVYVVKADTFGVRRPTKAERREIEEDADIAMLVRAHAHINQIPRSS